MNTDAIRDKVAIIGMGCTRFGETWDKGTDDLIIEAASEALEDAKIELKDIEAAWFGTVYSGTGGTPLVTALKLSDIPVTRVDNLCATAGDALRNACYPFKDLKDKEYIKFIKKFNINRILKWVDYFYKYDDSKLKYQIL